MRTLNPIYLFSSGYFKSKRVDTCHLIMFLYVVGDDKYNVLLMPPFLLTGWNSISFQVVVIAILVILHLAQEVVHHRNLDY